MDSNFFFKKKNLKVKKIFTNLKSTQDFYVNSVKPLHLANKKDITFFDSIKYKNDALSTKGGICITTETLKKYLPDSVQKVIVKNVLYELAIVLKKIYPTADIDYPDLSLKVIRKNKFKSVKFGNNVLVGLNVKIGKNTIIGSNSIIEKNVKIGKDCVIGSGVIIKNSFIGNRVIVQAVAISTSSLITTLPICGNLIFTLFIGIKPKPFCPILQLSCTIDRGSIDDTEIGKNTYLDNQVHIAHNVKIGSDCMIAGQVGFAGSSKIGNRVSIGGQAGISGHLKIGNNVKIGGGSGVVKDIEDNQIVMGYPAVPLREFMKIKK